jgi:hypothetical protein
MTLVAGNVSCVCLRLFKKRGKQDMIDAC